MRKVLSILGQLSDEDVDWIIGNGEKVSCLPGQELITVGQAVSKLYILLEGEVAIALATGAEVARLGVGEILGEMSLVEKSTPMVGARATGGKCVLLAVDHDKLSRKMEDDPRFAAHMYRAIAGFLSMRMRTTMNSLGYGRAGASLEDEIELDEDVLDKVHLAGARFERMRQILN